MTSLFGFLDQPVRVVEPRTAESLKYACNAFHATKVSFANEMSRLLRLRGVDSREVMSLFCEDQVLNISPAYLRPGFAFGGSCLPKDLGPCCTWPARTAWTCPCWPAPWPRTS